MARFQNNFRNVSWVTLYRNLENAFIAMSGWSLALGKLPVPGRPTIWMIVGQGPPALPVGAGGGCLDIFTHLSFLSSVSFSLGDDPIQTEILSQGAVKSKTTNQPLPRTKWPPELKIEKSL